MSSTCDLTFRINLIEGFARNVTELFQGQFRIAFLECITPGQLYLRGGTQIATVARARLAPKGADLRMRLPSGGRLAPLLKWHPYHPGVIGKVVTAPFVANSRQRGRCASALAVPTSTRLASRGYISPCSVSDNKSDYTRITLK